MMVNIFSRRSDAGATNNVGALQVDGGLYARRRRPPSLREDQAARIIQKIFRKILAKRVGR